MPQSASRPDKAQLLMEIVTKLSAELAVLEASATSAREAATHEESRAEDMHDTRGLEASYLAGAQAARVAELRGRIARLRAISARPFAVDEAVAPGALLELEHEGRRAFYLLLAVGGAPSLVWDGKPVHVITPESPLGDALLGQRRGDAVEVESQGRVREYLILECT